MAKDIEEKIGAMSQKNWYSLKYKNPLKNYRVHEMPTGDQLPPHYKDGEYGNIYRNLLDILNKKCFIIYKYLKWVMPLNWLVFLI